MGSLLGFRVIQLQVIIDEFCIEQLAKVQRHLQQAKWGVTCHCSKGRWWSGQPYFEGNGNHCGIQQKEPQRNDDEIPPLRVRGVLQGLVFGALRSEGGIDDDASQAVLINTHLLCLPNIANDTKENDKKKLE